MNPRNADVFISYSSKDEKDARIIRLHLEKRGIKAWMAPSDISPGPFPLKIANAIDKCKIFLLILSPNAIRSEWVREEILAALNAGKTIIPVRIEAVSPEQLAQDIWTLIHQLQMYDAIPPDDTKIKELVDNIIKPLLEREKELSEKLKKQNEALEELKKENERLKKKLEEQKKQIEKNRKKDRLKKLGAGIGIGIIIAAILIAILPSLDNTPPNITIGYPVNGSSVPMFFDVEGYLNKNLGEDQHLYCIVDWQGLCWPQKGELPVMQEDGKFKFSVPVQVGQENDTGKKFTIRIVIVDSRLDSYFKDWFEENTRKGEWPPILYDELVSDKHGKILNEAHVTVTRA